MERQKKIEILEGALERAFSDLDTKDYGPGALKDLTDAIAGIECVLDMERTRFGMSEGCDCHREAQVIDFPTLSEPETPEDVKETDTPAPETPTITKDELREKVSALSNKHRDLDAFAIMQSMGYSKLSDIPPSRYAEYLSKVESAAAEVK